jgi:hypothetical protein
VGFVTFPLFILEESAQMATFGTWAAKSTGNPELLLQGAEIIDSCNRMTRIINRSLGWIQPLSFYSYEHWYTASQFYSDTLKAQVLVQNPDLFVGKQVDIEFSPKQIEIQDDGRQILTNGKMGFIPLQDAKLEKIRAKGTMIRENGRYLIIEK